MLLNQILIYDVRLHYYQVMFILGIQTLLISSLKDLTKGLE